MYRSYLTRRYKNTGDAVRYISSWQTEMHIVSSRASLMVQPDAKVVWKHSELSKCKWEKHFITLENVPIFRCDFSQFRIVLSLSETPAHEFTSHKTTFHPFRLISKSLSIAKILSFTPQTRRREFAPVLLSFSVTGTPVSLYTSITSVTFLATQVHNTHALTPHTVRLGPQSRVARRRTTEKFCPLPRRERQKVGLYISYPACDTIMQWLDR